MSKTYVAWLDLETTGTDEKREPIIEVGVALCEDGPGMEPVDEFQAVIDPGPTFWAGFPRNVNGVVLGMHDANGLWDEAREAPYAISDVDDELADWLRGYAGTRHVILAGSGVSHFDRRFIAAQMPLTDKRLTFWSLDVGSVRRMLRRTAPGLVRPERTEGKAHRALVDALDHRDEWLSYEAAMAGLEAAA